LLRARAVCPVRQPRGWYSSVIEAEDWAAPKLHLAQVGFKRCLWQEQLTFVRARGSVPSKAERDSYRQFWSLVDLIDESLKPRSVYPEPLHLGD